jgi:phosphinothricin acetyltransferase
MTLESIEALEGADPDIVSLLDAVGLPRPDKSPIAFWKLAQGQSCVGVVGSERWGSVALLRSLAVKPTARRRGFATHLVRTALESLQQQGIREVWLFTETAHDYFLEWGFLDRSRSHSPRVIETSQEGRGACPASAALMALDLTRPVLHVRRARTTDAAAIAHIYNQGIRDRLATLETAERTPEDRVVWLTERSKRFPVLVALDAQGVAGWLSLNPFSPREAYRSVADVSVYVDGRARRTGVGSRLVQAGMIEASRQGFHKLVLTLFPENHAARALYLRRGFQSVGILREQGVLDGRWRDTEMMDYLLPSRPPAASEPNADPRS